MNEIGQSFSSSIGRKVVMALSAFFLLVFLFQHFLINFTSIVSEKTFNSISHFMGTSPLIQFMLQPVLMFGVLYHFIMGFILEIQNRNARDIKYAVKKDSASATWASRNMIYSGAFILLFLGFHFYDFWIPEINYKYIEMNPEDPNRYYQEVVHMFKNPIRVFVYILSFIFLYLHLKHGFQSAFQSLGMRHLKYTPIIVKLGNIYAVFVPLGYVFIALFHFLS